jgi:large subunit ribosomal protein L13
MSASAERQWYLIDAKDRVLGRLAATIAKILMGKHKPQYVPHLDTGDFVVVINAEKVKLTGRKLTQKRYFRHSNYPGGLKARTAKEMLAQKPEDVIRLAVRGMLPKTVLGRKMLKKLKVYRGDTHPHASQRPVPLNFKEVGLA